MSWRWPPPYPRLAVRRPWWKPTREANRRKSSLETRRSAHRPHLHAVSIPAATDPRRSGHSTRPSRWRSQRVRLLQRRGLGAMLVTLAAGGRTSCIGCWWPPARAAADCQQSESPMSIMHIWDMFMYHRLSEGPGLALCRDQKSRWSFTRLNYSITLIALITCSTDPRRAGGGLFECFPGKQLRAYAGRAARARVFCLSGSARAPCA